jgi:hypothetical protein
VPRAGQLDHGLALVEAISGAELLVLQGAGHGVVRADWHKIVRAIICQTQTGAG